MVHGCMVYTERAEMAAVSCGTSHASAVSTPLRSIFKTKLKSYETLVTHVEPHASTVSLFESAEWHYIKAINNNNLQLDVCNVLSLYLQRPQRDVTSLV